MHLADELKNATFAVLSGIPNYLAAIETQTWLAIGKAVLVPLFVGLVLKGVDIVYRELKERRGNGNKDEN